MIAWCNILDGTIHYSPSLQLMGEQPSRIFIAKAQRVRLMQAIHAECTFGSGPFERFVPGVTEAFDQIAAHSAILDFQRRINWRLAHLADAEVAWYDAKLLKPDSDITVLCGFADGSIETGYYDSADDCWRSSADAIRFNEQLACWADLPEVPKAMIKESEVAA